MADPLAPPASDEDRGQDAATVREQCEKHLALASRVAARYCNRRGQFPDAFQDAACGLMRAVALYDESRGEWANFAGHCCAQDVRRGLAIWRPSRVSGRARFDLAAIRKARHRDDPDPEAAASLRAAVSGLPDRMALILRLRFGLDGGEPLLLREVGEHLAISKQRVRAIEARALALLREMLADADAA